jgi:hypothetical protein
MSRRSPRAILGRVGAGEDDERLRFVDTVLYDLAFGGGITGGVGVMRRPAEDAPGLVMIQSGEEGRLELALPDLTVPDTIVAFVGELQAHVIEVQGEPRPDCPSHPSAHALACRAVADEILWVCPEGDWRCPLGQYDELNWPPADLGAEIVPGRVFDRLARRKIPEFRAAHGERRDGRWIVCIGVWPMSDTIVARLGEIAAPVDVEVYPEPGQWWAG